MAAFRSPESQIENAEVDIEQRRFALEDDIRFLEQHLEALREGAVANGKTPTRDEIALIAKVGNELLQKKKEYQDLTDN